MGVYWQCMKKNKGILVKNMNRTHENKWVALSADRKKVIGSSVDLLALKKQVGDAKVIFTRVPPAGAILAF